MEPGGGGRFAALVRKFIGEGVSPDRARGRAAMIGRRKYGAKKMARFAARGRRRAESAG